MESTGTGPEDAAVDRTRAALAALGADPDSAPDVPPEVTARIERSRRYSLTPIQAKKSQNVTCT